MRPLVASPPPPPLPTITTNCLLLPFRLSFSLSCHTLAAAFQIASLPQNKRLSPHLHTPPPQKRAALPPAQRPKEKRKENGTPVDPKRGENAGRNERRCSEKLGKGEKRWRTHQASITGTWGRWRGGRVGQGRLSFSHHF